MKFAIVALFMLLIGAPATAQTVKPLFRSDDVIHIVIHGPIKSIARNRSERPVAGILSIGDETLPIALSARGITRKANDVCDFPPIRVAFTQVPPPSSLFAGQKHLKLVTHCRNSEDFQQHLLLEYAAYRMYNLLTPLSFRVRLASIDYVDEDGRPVISRYGFFLEDSKDVAKRNGLEELHAPNVIAISALSASDAARYAMFEHMIGNHDWSMRAGPKGDDCCHNAKLIGAAGLAANSVVPLPYDFDFSGLVDAPYATPPDQLAINSVRERRYRGYCTGNPQALAIAGRMRAMRPQLLATLASTPGLDERTEKKAAAYLQGFFDQIANDDEVRSNVLNSCL